MAFWEWRLLFGSRRGGGREGKQVDRVERNRQQKGQKDSHASLGGAGASETLNPLVSETMAGITDVVVFDRMVRRFYPGLHSYVAHILRSSDGADDVLQDVFLRLWRTRDRVRDDTPVRPYLYAAARNATRNRLRSVRRATSVQEVLVLNGLSADASFDEPDAGTDLQVAATDAIESLPERCREVWALVREQGLSYADAAMVLGVSVHAINKQMSRALKLLRAALAPFLAAAMYVR